MSRILYLLDGYPKWSETFIRQELSLLLKHELPLSPLAMNHGDIENPHPDWPQVQYLKSAAVSDQKPSGIRGFLAKRFKMFCNPTTYTQMALKKHSKTIDEIADFIDNNNITHIHAEFATLPALIASHLAYEMDLSYSISVHANDVYTFKYDPEYVFAEAKFILTCNGSARKQLLDMLPVVTPRTHVVHHGIILKNWPFRSYQPPQSGDSLKLLFVGRFVEKKGIPVLLESVAELNKNDIPVKLTMQGSGPLEKQLREQADNLGITTVIDWLPVCHREQLPEVYAKHDIFVLPGAIANDGDRDGIPNVLLEAAATGLPMLGSPVGSISEILTENTGWLFTQGDSAQLLEKLWSILRCPKECAKKARNARKLVEVSFNAEKLIQQRLSLFKSLDKKRREGETWERFLTQTYSMEEPEP